MKNSVPKLDTVAEDKKDQTISSEAVIPPKKPNKKIIFTIILAVLVGILATTAVFMIFSKSTSFFKAQITPFPTAEVTKDALNVGVGAMILPGEGKQYYSDLADWLGEKTGRKINLVFKKSYKEMNDALKSGQVDISFVCGQPYVEGKKDFGLELLAAPVVKGKLTYNSYIIVPKGSSAKKLSDLRGKTFAFTDPISNTGKLVPTYMLAKAGETPEKFFGKIIFSGAHDASINAVANGMIDGAAVDSLILDYIKKRKPGLTGETKIIETSPPYGIPPVVVRPGLDQLLKAKLQKTLLEANSDPKAKAILANMDIERFSLIEDSAYVPIREMIDFLGAKLQ